MRKKLVLCAFAALIVGNVLTNQAFARDFDAPELSPGSAGGAMTLLAAAGMMIKDRFSRRK